MVTHYDFHPFSQIFPLITGEEFASLKSDIEAKGQREPVILHEGKILDGRNRYRCCVELDIEPTVEHYTGSDPLGHVMSLNLYRRQLNVAQRALIAAEFSSLKATDTSTPLNLDEAAKVMAVSPRSISSACKVVREAVPELLHAVKEGEVSISAAELLCKLDAETQRELCEEGAKAICAAARDIRAESKPATKTKPKAVEKTECIDSTEMSPAADIPEAVVPSTITAYSEQYKESYKKPPATLRMFELANEAMEEGYEPETLVGQILDEVEDGLDIQLLLFTAQAMSQLLPKLQARALRKNF